jgi:regulator of protease activity HflC (stomatin/prohibitin superfamily)
MTTKSDDFQTAVKDDIMKKMAGHVTTGITIAVALVVVLIILRSIVWTVPAGYAGVIYSASEGVKAYSYPAGWHFKLPIIESASIIDCRVLKFESMATAASKDMQNVNAKIALNYHVDIAKAHDLYKAIGHEYEARVIAPAIEESVRAVTAKYTAEELITKREMVSTEIQDMITQKMSRFNILVDAFNIIDFQFSTDFNHAIEQKQVAEQEAQREHNVLTKVKIQAQQRIAEAEGMKQAAILSAEGQANATLIVAQAQAKSIQMQAEALKTNPELVELRKVEKWNGQMPNFMMGANQPMIMDLSKVATK